MLKAEYRKETTGSPTKYSKGKQEDNMYGCQQKEELKIRQFFKYHLMEDSDLS